MGILTDISKRIVGAVKEAWRNKVPVKAVVEIGLNIKRMSPHKFTFVSGHTNGDIGYAPTVEQYKGEAYEDTNCLLAPEWQKIYEEKVLDILKKL